jgi:hypothetical protein
LHVEGGQRCITQFVRSVAAGAGLHLRFTRSLTFEDAPPPRDQLSLDPNKQDMESNYLLGSQTDEEKDNSMVLILHMFPQDSLSTFE